MKPSFTTIVLVLFTAYIGHSVWTIYQLFNPKECPPKGDCIKPYLARNPPLELSVYTSLKDRFTEKSAKLAWKCSNFSLLNLQESTVSVKLPKQTRHNGSLYVHAFLHEKGQNPLSHSKTSYAQSRLTTYAYPKATAFNLLNVMGNSTENVTSNGDAKRQLIAHWRSKMTVNVLSDLVSFPRREIPGELFRFMRFTNDEYLPILYIDELAYRIADQQPINESSMEVPLTISYSPISVGKLRFWVSIQHSMDMLHQLGFGEKDTDEMKGIFADTNFYFLMLTFVVAAFHLLFDFLAFKNDISFWKNRDSMVGLSTKVVLWRCISTTIIFFYLLDQETSLLVLIPSGIGAVIELWKVKKAFKATLHWTGWKPSVQLGTQSDKERETEAFDSQAMKYLSYVLYPLCLAGAIYSLFYTPHKSWYSWCIQSLVNGIYAFGFLFMMPQLFVNYKLKSVAHLPWRAFMYKAFNTFIDDIFAFIITMPTAHRLACFRDDVIFVIYLYQRWLYPVDKTRVNEYGQSFEEPTDKEKKEQ